MKLKLMKQKNCKYKAPASEVVEVLVEQTLMTVSYKGNGTIEDGQLEYWDEL